MNPTNAFAPDVSIRSSHAEYEIGKKGMILLSALLKHLTGTDSGRLETEGFRYAPAFVCRGEASLLGVSTPRFAFRINLPGSGFLSVRRFVRLADECRRLKVELIGVQDNSPDYSVLPSFIERSSMIIADSFLPLPHKFSRFNFIGTRLSRWYAEGEFVGSPYLQAFQIGGGVCAQACAFMSSAMLDDHITDLHDPGDISAVRQLGKEFDGPVKINISGMSMSELDMYFKKIGLRGPIHKFRVGDASSPNPILKESVELVLKTLILSGFPVVVPIDLGRIAGNVARGSSRYRKSIYRENSLSRNLYPAPPADIKQHHGIVVIGYCKGELLVHDPASSPYLSCTIDDLVESRPYDDNSIGNVFADNQLQQFFDVQAVLPNEVGVFLTTWSDEEDGYYGLDEEYSRLCDSPEFWLDCQVPTRVAERLPKNISECEVRLIECGELTGTSLERQSNSITSFPCHESVHSKIQNVLKQFPSKFCLLQRIDSQDAEVYWLFWDATKRHRNRIYGGATNPEMRPLAVFAEAKIDDSGKAHLHQLMRNFDKARSKVHLRSPKPRQNSGISFNPRIISSVFPNLALATLIDFRTKLVEHQIIAPTDRLPIELYIDMQISPGNFHHVSPSNEESVAAVPFLNEIAFTNQLESWANQLIQFLDYGLLKVEGIASYIPEISSHRQNVRKSAIKSLAAMQDIAYFLYKHAHPVEFIEIVGGSLADQVYYDVGSTKEVNASWEMEIASRDEKIERIADVLEVACETARIHRKNLKLIPFCTELEPGPRYVLNSVSACERLIRSCSKRGFDVGFNADASHIVLSGQTENYLNSKLLLSRTTNIHISGMGPFHFGDMEFVSLSTEERRIILAAMKEGNVCQNGKVSASLEYEAAPPNESIIRSFSRLKNQRF